jgi:saccharopine dehydrogenase (NAD+, L-lysine forming)
MIRIGLIREEKVPTDNRVALTPAQCKWIVKNSSDISISVQSSPGRCFSDKEYVSAGIDVKEDMNDCDILLGIKEVPHDKLIAGKTYLFFSHTKKLQPWNREMLQTIVKNNITLIDYECLEHEDGTRIIGFGFFAGIVGAHNGIMAYGKRTGLYDLDRVYKVKSFRELIHTYFGLKLPNIKVAVTGSGRVAHGVLEIMNLLGLHEVEPDEFLSREFNYPVYVQLKGSALYAHNENGSYSRDHFHDHPDQYHSLFLPYAHQANILMNGVYWDQAIPRLFEKQHISDPAFRISTIADITDDANGSVPINVGDQTIIDPVYGVDRQSF